ncbi:MULTISPECIES: 4-oxalocrotonate tautomerase DmpI [Clostridia]|uniref:Tautomerase family protein n=1 Tax=Desulfosporosinus nitroreducens TaxID=2018668 RepID=A0ABT8QVM6_9FIRM|nr:MULTISPECIES: 4-oxalocrotonate tautomerase DmpI [Clostridia]MCO1604536.1 tautomerase family protein [Desulfosporosinus nitroreducens]MDO0825402.1 tautomerase family protein [Desulfosporosinus nitroreducens]
MPVIMVEGIPLSADQKRELVAILTKSASSIMNVSEQAFQVYIKENSRDNIGVGGILVSERNK